MLRWILLVLLLFAMGFLGIAFLPGSVEGNYRGLAPSCMCDGISFIQLRGGKLIYYNSNHPPASIMGRYQKSPDGGVEVWLTEWRKDQPEKLLFKAYPRFLITQFVGAEDGQKSWCLKWPSIGRVGEALQTQEVSEVHPRKENISSRDIYDRNLKWIRYETKIGKGKWTEQAAAPPEGGNH